MWRTHIVLVADLTTIRQGLIAINYPAREAGIGRHCDVKEAKKLCPTLIAQHVATWREGDDKWAYRDDAAANMGHFCFEIIMLKGLILDFAALRHDHWHALGVDQCVRADLVQSSRIHCTHE